MYVLSSKIIYQSIPFKLRELYIYIFFFYRCTVHSDIHTVHSPTDAHLLKLWLQFTLNLSGSYMFRSTTIIREFAININISLARLNYKLPDDGRRPKHVGAT